VDPFNDERDSEGLRERSGATVSSVDLPLLTPRLMLRVWSLADGDAAFALLGDPATMGRMRAGRAETRDDAAVWVARRVEQQAQHGLTMWAVERLAEPGMLIGACGLFPHDDGLELGYIVERRHVGQGFATEAAKSACVAAREEWPDRCIYATIRPANTASTRVAERVGLRLTGQITDDAGTAGLRPVGADRRHISGYRCKVTGVSSPPRAVRPAMPAFARVTPWCGAGAIAAAAPLSVGALG